jgi:hypothetical protein
MAEIPIRYADASQQTEALQKVAADVSKILTPHEEILYIALQNNTALSIAKDSVVATNNRIICYKPSILGRVAFEDFLWQDVKDDKITQGFLATDFSVETVRGKRAELTSLDKDQAKRLYAICQQMEQEWREKRRVREMEEARAKAGGVNIAAPQSGNAPADDPVAKLAKAKQMLDQSLISEAEYESLKARILSSM